MRRRLKVVLLAVVLPFLLIGGGAAALVHKLKPQGDSSRTAAVERGDVVVAVKETGSVEPIKRVEVKSRVSGQLVHLAVDEGDWVEKGQLIARLDVPELEAQRDQVKAQLAGARARLEQAKLSCDLDRQLIESQLARAEASLRSAEAAVDEAGTRLRDAERVYENKRRLLEMGGYVSQNDVDSAKAAVDLSVQQRRSAQERVREQEAAMAIAEARRAESKLSESRITEAQASLRQIQDSLAEIEARLRDAAIRAPCSGTVIVRHVREGELITAVSYYGSGAPLVTIGDLSTMLIKVDLNEVDVDKVRLGQQVEIEIDALPKETYEGTVTRISPASVMRPRDGQMGIVRFPIEITVSGPCASLKPGMTASAEIACDSVEDALWAPNDALFEKDGEEGTFYVSVVTGEENGERLTEDREVALGLENDSRTEITAGIEEGDEVELGKAGIPERKKLDIRRQADEGDE
jgi:HlyD family secretion protein